VKRHGKLDRLLEQRASDTKGRTRVIVRLRPGASFDAIARTLPGSKRGRKLSLIGAHVVELPNSALRALERHGDVLGLSLDRPISAHMERTSATIAANVVPVVTGT
jgi:hypothetical protein